MRTLVSQCEQKVSRMDGRHRCDGDHISPLGLVQLPSLQFRASNVTAASRFVVPALLFLRLWDHRRNGEMASRRVHSNECKVGGTHVLAMIEQVVFNVNLNSNLHRGVEDPVHGRAKDYEIADVSWCPKVKMVNRRRNHVVAAMPMRRHCACEVDPVHEASAQKSSERVSIVRKNNFGRSEERRVGKECRSRWSPDH